MLFVARKSRQMSIKVAQKMISLKMTKNVGDLDKLIVAKGFKKLPKVEKCPIWSHCLRGC